MSKNSSRANCSSRASDRFGRGGGRLALSTAREIFAKNAESAEHFRKRAIPQTWVNPDPLRPLDAEELAREMQRLANRKGFRLTPKKK